MIYIVRLVYIDRYGIDHHMHRLFSTFDQARSYAISQRSKLNSYWRVQIASLVGVKFDDLEI